MNKNKNAVDIWDKKITELLNIHITSSSGPRKNIRQSRELELRSSIVEITSKSTGKIYRKEIPLGHYSRKTMKKLATDFIQDIFNKEKTAKK